MKRSLITALILCSISWISVSGSESHTETVEGRPGGEVTLTCSNPSNQDATTLWLRVVNRTKASWNSTITRSKGTPLYSDGIQNGRFNMITTFFTLFLQIKHVDVSDSGLYLCGFFIEGRYNFSAIHLNVNGSDDSHDDADRKSESSDESHDDDRKSEKSDGTAKLMSLILGALTVLLLMVNIGLVVTIRKLQKAANEEQNPQQPENQASEELNYAAVAFRPKTRKTREVEPNVVYASTR
ncbi:uncharacterized protein LOC114574006 [Perca flavescens]|uniref:uncharacterized protein LOC114574006 n=1 Tax=Perca flavescens TaxID=8167 RepID=UPI00106E41F7|nr:uncharacterized protein LOC114574006 [Perca flavescens]XP_028462084.1 uncharacterized protein LOC114574006 [Perca flavescens]XP_028462085.1 uncharacterized protein LOC114574006 [Perca flavescens]